MASSIATPKGNEQPQQQLDTTKASGGLDVDWLLYKKGRAIPLASLVRMHEVVAY